MASEWKKVALGEITDLVIDYRGKTPKKLGGDWSRTGYRALSAKNIKMGHIVQSESIRFVDEAMYKKWMKDEIQRGDILITSEAPFGQIYFWDSDEKVVLSQRLFGVRIKKEYDPKYVYYYMITDDFQGEMDGRATGTTVVGLRQPELLKCELRCPDYDTQIKIASVLSAIDSKIELNEEISDNLQQQVKLLTKAWLVDYEPFDGEMPVDWRNISLADIADFIPGYSYKGTELQPSTTAMATIKNFDRGGGFKLDGFKEIMPSSKIKPCHYATKFDILVAHTDLTQKAEVIGNAELIPNLAGYESIVFSMDLVKVIPKSTQISQFMIAALMQDPRFKSHCMGYVNGTTVLHLSKKALLDYKFDFPNNINVLAPLDRTLQALYEGIANIVEENRKLFELRDSLLPKLMSGEIDVSDIQ